MVLFKILGRIAINNGEANSAIDETTSKASTFGDKIASGIKTVTKWGVAIGAAAVAGGTAIVKFSTDAASAGDRIDKMSQKIGISREAFQELDFICSQSGTSVDTLQQGIKTLTNQMQSAADGTESACEIFDKLGVSITDSSGALKSQEDMMWEAMSALQGMENQTEKAALANDLFGRSGTELMPLLNGAAGSIEEMKQKAHELGLVMSDEFVDNSVKYTDTMDQLKRSFKNAGLSIISNFLPFIQNIADKMVDFMPTIQEFAANISDKLGEALDWASEKIEAFQEKWPEIKERLIEVGNYAVDAFAPAIETVKNLFISLKEALQPVIDKVKEYFNSGQAATDGTTLLQGAITILAVVLQSIATIFLYVVETIKFVVEGLKGLYEEAVEFIQSVPERFEEFKESIETIITTLVSKALALWESLKTGFKDKVEEIRTNIQEKFQNVKDTIEEKITGAKEKAVEIFSSIKEEIQSKIEDAKDKVGEAIEKMKSFFNFEWNLPKIKLPHFTKIGETELGLPKIGVEWYAKGGVLNQPTVFGVNPVSGNAMVGGESGAEAVAPIDVLQGYVAEAVASQNAGLITVLERILDAIIAMDENMGGNLREALDGTAFKINNREFGRLVRSVV